MRKMKDSGIEWIGEIPEGWEVRKLKYVFEVINGATPKSNDSSFWDGNIAWITPADYSTEQKYITDSKKYITENGLNSCGTTLVPKESLIISNRAPIGLIAIANIELCTNQGCKSLVKKCELETRYYYFYLSIMDNPLNMLGKGTTFMELSSSELKDFKIPYVNYEEQQRISDYLDRKCTEIDSVIKSKETTNEKLKEYRQSLIYEAVTKGLDRTAKMKDSGIEWIGEIPEGWETVKLKYSSLLKGRIGWQGLKSDEFIDEGPYLVTGTDFFNGVINWDNCVHVSKERYEEAPEIHVFEDDLLITKDGTVGKIALATGCPEKVSLNSGVMVIRKNNNINYINKYLYFVLCSDVFWKWFKISQNGNSTIIHLYQEQFSNFIYPLPSKKEQKQIAGYLKNICTEIDGVISTNTKIIDRLKECRQSVIYEAVTGKTEV